MALALSLGAQCFVDDEMSAAQMACCAAADHDCGTAAAVEDCCQTERNEQAQLVKQTQQLVPPLALLSTIPALVRPADSYSASVVDATTTVLKVVSPPKYVLLASFLI